jgi:hypothetical protein
MNASRFRMGATSGRVTSMTVRVASVDASPNNQFQVAIYSDSSGKPGTLIAKSGNGTLKAFSWSTVAISATLEANKYYWLTYNTNASRDVNNMLYDSRSTAQSSWRTPVSFGTWPSTFGSATSQFGVFSIYATYTPITTQTVDTTPPVIAITSPANGATLSSSTSVQINVATTATDVSGINNIKIYVDSTLLKTCNSTTSCSTFWTPTAGAHVIRATATDNAPTPNTGSASIGVSVN